MKKSKCSVNGWRGFDWRDIWLMNRATAPTWLLLIHFGSLEILPVWNQTEPKWKCQWVATHPLIQSKWIELQLWKHPLVSPSHVGKHLLVSWNQHFEACSCCAVWEDRGSVQDKNGKWWSLWPWVFLKDEAWSYLSWRRISPFHWISSQSRPEDPGSDQPEGNLTMDQRRRYVTELSAENNGGKQLLWATQKLLLLPLSITWRTHSHLQQQAQR